MAKDVFIRAAKLGDAAEIQAMIAALALEAHGPAQVLTIEDVTKYGFGAEPAFQALVAEIDGAVMGLAIFFPEFSTWRGRRGIYLQDIYVKPEARGRGVGKELIDALTREAKEMSAVYLRLAVDSDNHDAARFYERLGFAEAHRDRIFMLTDDAFGKGAAQSSRGKGDDT
ncbi:GNAT family N-acetyltransferase [Hyphococcus sp.]|uniref:GNAT family N-acetyltransferase n=1 Tax=Hyphococcus sp. TaxID=2038636 RepID=UPI0035C691E9